MKVLGFAMKTLSLCLLAGAIVFGAQKTPLKVGDQAPNFTLAATNSTTVTLSTYRGAKNVVLAFFPKAFTGG